MGVLEDYDEYLLDQQRLDYKTRQEEIAAVAEQNARSLAIHQAGWEQTQAIAYRTSVAAFVDARAQAEEFQIQSQEFLIESGQRTQTQVTEFGASGAMVAGSALARMDMTRSRGVEGASRLSERADIALERGDLAAAAARESAIEPMYVPIPLPAELMDPDSDEATAARATAVAARASLSASSGGGGGGGGGGGSGPSWRDESWVMPGPGGVLKEYKWHSKKRRDFVFRELDKYSRDVDEFGDIRVRRTPGGDDPLAAVDQLAPVGSGLPDLRDFRLASGASAQEGSGDPARRIGDIIEGFRDEREGRNGSKGSRYGDASGFDPGAGFLY